MATLKPAWQGKKALKAAWRQRGQGMIWHEMSAGTGRPWKNGETLFIGWKEGKDWQYRIAEVWDGQDGTLTGHDTGRATHWARPPKGGPR